MKKNKNTSFALPICFLFAPFEYISNNIVSPGSSEISEATNPALTASGTPIMENTKELSFDEPSPTQKSVPSPTPTPALTTSKKLTLEYITLSQVFDSPVKGRTSMRTIFRAVLAAPLSSIIAMLLPPLEGKHLSR